MQVMNLIGKNVGEGGGRERIPGYTTEILCAKAREHGIYIHAGSLTEETGKKRSANTSVLIGPDGAILASYRKLHMFDITLADGASFCESDRVSPGNEAVTVQTGLGIFGMSICYDVRFPELYRLMALKGDREWLLYRGHRPDRDKARLYGLWQQPGRGSVGNRDGQGQRYAGHHVCEDRFGFP